MPRDRALQEIAGLADRSCSAARNPLDGRGGRRGPASADLQMSAGTGDELRPVTTLAGGAGTNSTDAQRGLPAWGLLAVAALGGRDGGLRL